MASRHMLAAPPCIRARRGYFFVWSNPGGSTRKLWIFLPRDDVNQKCTGASQSMRSAFSTLNAVMFVHFFATGSTRTISFGLIDEPQRAMRIVDGALSGITR